MPTLPETTITRQTPAAGEAPPEFWPDGPESWPDWTDEFVWYPIDSPVELEAHIAREARELATPGMPAAPIAVALFRDAYRALWARYQAEVIPFMS